ncbi:N-acetyltransferase 10 [Tieghemiomyces parasiticus]|uniref:RNA cytidine acetyltransferase n=1 Tax=Tieghemiomyces parasiticus TaxID=78921 RepID=A0A9W8DRF2_9FUNG|nr:N-acetyltransferase 10 [Tieghemiomyces parasiticus]
MVRKAVDPRVHTLIKRNVESKHRSFFVIVGDRGKDQIVNLHWMLSQTQVTSRPSVLWCYKKDLGFTTHRKKRETILKREIRKGIRKANEEDPFELFVTATNIRYTYYKETQNILGNTYGMCVLQDFEALTPNLLARTIETVEGGGLVVILLKTMRSLKQLYTLTMDVHSRYRTEAHQDVVARFNERFILSLGSCDSCLVVDDELNVLPISMGKNIRTGAGESASGLPGTTTSHVSAHEAELRELKDSLADTQPIGALIATARTLDQAKAIMTFADAISEKTLRSTVALTASRGRGKSAALGVSIAAAVAYGYSNVFVTSPSPENLKTLFEFIFKGFDALGYEEHLDYDIVQSTNPDFHKAIVRVNVFRQHRQTIQYIQPQDAHVLGQAELVVIDEAAAIPLPLVKKLLGPYLVFMSSTINGYEGTGRSLSLKLIQQLREQSTGLSRGKATGGGPEGTLVGRDGKPRRATGEAEAAGPMGTTGNLTGGRVLREIKLEEPIRYAAGDSVEKWLNRLLCLDATVVSKNIQGCPHPSECELYYVTRDTLFSYHPVSETFLQRMMALYVASHYKNTPNDLQLMSDAPAHHLFVLLPPVDPAANTLPDPLVVVQVCLEGQISRESILSGLSRGNRASGDMIPWLMAQQFQDSDFAQLSGARVVRIATHPDYAGMGYGARALDQLRGFYSGEFQNLDEGTTRPEDAIREASYPQITDAELENADLRTDRPKVRDPRQMPPLLMKLSEKPAPRLHYLGVSYGLTAHLHKFWKRASFAPVYLRQTPNELTGEHTCVMLRSLPVDPTGQSVVVDDTWLAAFANDFQRRFIHLLSYQFRDFTSVTALSIINNLQDVFGTQPEGEDSEAAAAAMAAVLNAPQVIDNRDDLFRAFTPFDLKRLESYSNNLLDHHIIMDLLPTLSSLYFNRQMIDNAAKQDILTGRYPPLVLSAVQSSIILAMGLQCKPVEAIEKELNLPSSQVLGILIKIIKKMYNSLHFVQSRIPTSTNVVNEAPTTMLPGFNDGSAPSSHRRALPQSSNRVINPDTIDAEDATWAPLDKSIDQDVGKAGREVMDSIRAEQRKMIESLNLSEYSLDGEDKDWSQAEALIAKGAGASIVSVANPNEVSGEMKSGLGKKRSSGSGGNGGKGGSHKSKRPKTQGGGGGSGKSKKRN